MVPDIAGLSALPHGAAVPKAGSVFTPQAVEPLSPLVFEHHYFDRTVDRLYREFGGQFNRPSIARVLLRGVRDLAGSPAGAMPELSERLARQRLLDEVSPDGRVACSNSQPLAV